MRENKKIYLQALLWAEVEEMSSGLEKKDELYAMVKKVCKNTNAYIVFRMTPDELDIYVIDKGFDASADFDGHYVFYGSEKLKNETELQYKSSKRTFREIIAGGVV